MTAALSPAPAPADLALLDRLTDAEYDNYRAMVRDLEAEPGDVPTLASTLDSWEQMPEHVRSALADRPEQVEPTLRRLIDTHGPACTIDALYGLPVDA